jgi:hypothetical protein
MKLQLDYENPRINAGGRNVWDYALFAVCLSVGLLMFFTLLFLVAVA